MQREKVVIKRWRKSNVEVEKFFARACFQAGARFGEPAACRWFVNWYEDTRRPDMRVQLLAGVNRALDQRLRERQVSQSHRPEDSAAA